MPYVLKLKDKYPIKVKCCSVKQSYTAAFVPYVSSLRSELDLPCESFAHGTGSRLRRGHLVDNHDAHPLYFTRQLVSSEGMRLKGTTFIDSLPNEFGNIFVAGV